ncbi:hypothetical protein [Xanthomonas phaseoli]|uniref:hypothetical protein n=1 Tax=Xanthomonas phaseoli TaxID=1985254 RepID=UPI000B1BC3AE|nr:hypothetical protein [Xanthomonas phaseoli]UZB30905.1 hypothetical protein OM951_10780 [Xanthomonas phaseoli pv. phaseoli]
MSDERSRQIAADPEFKPYNCAEDERFFLIKRTASWHCAETPSRRQQRLAQLIRRT